MAQEINVPQDEEFKKELRDALEKPTKWYLERVDRAVRGKFAKQGRKGKSVSVSRKGRGRVH